MKLRIILMVASLLLSLAIGLNLRHTGNEAAAAKTGARKIRIGLSLDTLKEARWQMDRDLFLAAAAKNGAEVFVQSANSNDTKQTQEISRASSAAASTCS